MVEKLKEEVEQLGVDYNSIHVTVSETKGESLAFFTKKGFQVVYTWVGRYLKGVKEHLLSCPRYAPSNVIPIDGVAQKFDRLYRARAQEDADLFAPELVHIVHDAHSDDIHCLKKLSDGTFVSGSKDNCLYKWNDRGERVRIVDEVEPIYRSERNWITAMEVINDEYWISGARDGELVLWKTNGDYVKQVKAVMPKVNDHVSHPFNSRRVTCLSAGSNVHKPSIFIGFPTMFDKYNFIEGRTENMTKVHANDWVYAIKPLSEKSVLTVIGGTIDSWNLTDKGWVYGEKLMPEEKKYQTIIDGKRKLVRPFISDVCSLNSQNSRFGLASFNGSVQVLDVTARAVTNRWNEHKGRVWKVEKLSEHVFASSSEDGLVKLWDVRQKSSVHTINVVSGQVTAMLALRDHVLLTGTCPELVQNYTKSAQIRFYDLKK